MRQVYLVTYDIRDSRRLRLVYKKMHGFGTHLQYSVFRCLLTPSMKVRMVAELSEIIDHRDDQVLIFNLGQENSVRSGQVEYLGMKYQATSRETAIV